MVLRRLKPKCQRKRTVRGRVRTSIKTWSLSNGTHILAVSSGGKVELTTTTGVHRKLSLHRPSERAGARHCGDLNSPRNRSCRPRLYSMHV
jgi:hypothetical protein